MQKSVEELQLESFLFGTEIPDGNQLHDDEQVDALPFFIDTTAGSDDSFPTTPTQEASTKAKWHDEHDDLISVNLLDKNIKRKLRVEESESTITGTEYAKRLRGQYEKIYGKPEWATSRASETENSLDFLRSTLGIKLTSKVKSNLDMDHVEVIRLKDANFEEYSNAVIQSCEFHPNANVVMTAGLDKTIRLFQISTFSSSHPKIQSIHVSDLPILSAKFSPNGKFVFLAGRRKFFYVYDLTNSSIEKIAHIRGVDIKSLERMYTCEGYVVFVAKDGYIHFVSQTTKQWAKQIKINAQCIDIAFSANGRYCYVIGSDSMIYKWDLESFECIRNYKDDSNVHPTKIAVSHSEEYLAVGTKSGVVNVYSLPEMKLVKSITNLVTSIHLIEFHPSSQLMVIASRRQKDALRLVHIPSMRVYQNWPTSNTPLSYVNQASFSSDGKYLSIGNEKGKVLLYSFKAFL